MAVSPATIAFAAFAIVLHGAVWVPGFPSLPFVPT